MYSEKELEAEGLMDFRVFLYHTWAHLGLPHPTPVQKDIGKYLQHGPKRAIIQAFRGVGKSWITVAFVCWLLLLNPQRKIMVVSAGEDLASAFTKFCKQLITGMPVLQHLAPRPGQLDKMDVFDVGPALPSKDPSVKSVGITGQLTGSRADIIIPDDVEVPKNSYTFLLRERLGELVKEFDSLLKPGPDSRVLYLGTPQAEETLYGKLQGRGYETRIWPAEIPSNPSVYKGRLAPFIQRLMDAGAVAGTPVDPKRFDRADLDERLASYLRAGYNLQFMLDTTQTDADKRPLKLHDLIVHDVDQIMGHVQLVWGGAPNLVIQDLQAGGFDGDAYHRPAWLSPEMATYTATVMAIDPSGRGEDETGYAIIKYLNGFLYLVDVGGFVDGHSEDTLKALAGKALRWGVNDIIVEENFGGGMFAQLLKPHLQKVFANANKGELGSAGRIDEEWNGWSNTQKELRICDTLSPVVKNHRLVLSRALIEADLKQQQENARYSFIQQFTRIERMKGSLRNDDRVDAVAMACAYFEERMNRDAARAREEHKEAELDKELESFRQNAYFGFVDSTDNLIRQ